MGEMREREEWSRKLSATIRYMIQGTGTNGPNREGRSQCPWAMGIDVPATAPARVPGLTLESSTSALGDDARGLGRHMLG